MNTALVALAWTAVFCLLLWIPYVLARIGQKGLMGAMGNPSPDDPALPAWADRAKRAHMNLVENIGPFAVAVLIAHALGVSDPAVGTAAVVFFWARVAHWLVYTLGIPVVRTLAFAVAWIANLWILWLIIGALYGG
ncbi:MAG: MAPEG family protein [Rhodothalassiaceae bacterium]